MVRGVLRQSEDAAQAIQALLGLDRKDFGLDVPVDVAAQGQLAERLDFVAQPGGLLEQHGLARLLHLLLHLPEQPVFLAFEHQAQGPDLLACIPRA